MVSLQNPQPVVFVHLAQSVISEQTGGGQVPDAMTNELVETEVPHRGVRQVTVPADPEFEPQGG